MDTDHLATALMACATGIYAAEAGVALFIANGTFLRRDDFTSRFITTGTSISDGVTPMADIDWDGAITALHAGELPCSGGDRRILQLSASITGGVSINLHDTVTRLDCRNTARLPSRFNMRPDNRPWTADVDNLSRPGMRPTGETERDERSYSNHPTSCCNSCGH